MRSLKRDALPLFLCGLAMLAACESKMADQGVPDSAVGADSTPERDTVAPGPDAAPADGPSEPDAGLPAEQRIMPASQNPYYWQYKGKPLLLLGGAIHSNLFQVEGLEAHLDEIKAAGGNYVRNTMSQRTGWNLPGDLILPYKKLASGLYDLDKWNDAYWTMFKDLLRWCDDRDIIVQIEIWDYWDFAGPSWETNAFRPANNINYTPTDSGLANSAEASAYKDLQPFFHSVPAMDNNTLILGHQKAFVRKVLSYSLKHSNVLYTIDNETTVGAAWGAYWSAFIKKEAHAVGVEVETSEMWDDKDLSSARQRQSLDHPEVYSFLDVSQNNRNFDQAHWESLQWARSHISAAPRPLNNTKIYSAGDKSWGSGDPQQGVERFWRNIIGGAASSRFHRPPVVGIGLNTVAKSCIAAARKLESRIQLWEVDPRLDLLSDRADDEAYLAAVVDEKYALYFTKGGSVKLDIGGDASDKFELRWISIDTGMWGATSVLSGAAEVTIDAPDGGAWVAAIVKK